MTVEIEAEESTIKAGELALLVNEKGLRATPMPSIRAAIEKLMVLSLSPARVLICGSLYLAGQVLDKHN
jgi:folylpolyglutamate synthase/dihydropteroate synthase